MGDQLMYTDLSINIRAAWNRQHILNGGRHLERVPVWAVRVTQNEGYDDVVNEAPITHEQVLQVAALLDSFALNGAGVTRQIVPAVNASENKMRETFEAQLQAARAAASRIRGLEEVLGLEPGQEIR